MLRKKGKKAFIALLMTVVMTVTLAVSASAQVAPGSFDIGYGECPHKANSVYAYILEPTNLQVASYFEPCSAANSSNVYVMAIAILDNRQIVQLRGNGTFSNGMWEAAIDYTPPAGRTISTAVIGVYACNWARTW